LFHFLDAHEVLPGKEYFGSCRHITVVIRCCEGANKFLRWRSKPVGQFRIGSTSDFLLGGRTSAPAECRHWSGRSRPMRSRREGRWRVILQVLRHLRQLLANAAIASSRVAAYPVIQPLPSW